MGGHANVEILPPKKITFSLILAITHEGILHNKLIDKKKGVNSETFIGFLKEMLVKVKPHKKFYLIMDNASIHRSRLCKNFLKESYVQTRFLSPYSPEYNPVELCFAEIKRNLRYTFLDSQDIFKQKICRSVDQLDQNENIEKYISHTIRLYREREKFLKQNQ